MQDLVLQINILLLKLSLILIILVIVISIIKYLPKLLAKIKHSNLRLSKQESANGIILGRICNLVLFSPIANEGHFLVLGSSGSAKTTSILLPTLKSWTNGFFTIDISGDISNNLTNYSCPNTIHYDPTNMNSKVIYNPFHLIDQLNSQATINESLVKISYTLLPDNPQAHESSKWFDDGGRDILSATFIAFYNMNLDFQDICNKISCNDYATLFSMIDNTQNKDAIRFINQFSGMSEKNISGCYQSAVKAIQLFVSPVLQGKIHRPRHINDIVLTPESIENSKIFFIIPDSKKEQYSSLVELVVSQILEYISNRPAKYIDNKILIAIDEYASFRNLDLSEPLAKSRKKGCRIMILCQNLNQISRNFGEYAMREIVDNCDYNILCGISEPESQKYFSEKAGVKSKLIDTYEVKEKPVYKPEIFGKLRKTNIILAKGEHFRVIKNYFWKYY